MSVKHYQELIVWQRSMDLVDECYALIRLIPKEEQYALSDQMRRSAVSILSNIAEGQARDSTKEFAHFLSIANGSKAELETQLMICIRLNYLTRSQAETALNLCGEVGRMLNSLIKSLSTHQPLATSH